MTQDHDEQATATLHLGDSCWHSGPGWYYTIDDYGDEGSCGSFVAELEATEHARACGLEPTPCNPDGGPCRCLDPSRFPAAASTVALRVRPPESVIMAVDMVGARNDEQVSYGILMNRVEAALALIVKFGGIDGENHKTWVIDQVTRLLAGDGYDKLVSDTCATDHEWKTGIAP